MYVLCSGVVRVAVSSTPGKTKHFQTLVVSPSLLLCDCPGLVFPSFMSSTSEMICAGILPINHMRDYVQPAITVSSRIPQHLLEAAYGLKIKRNLDIQDNPDRPPTPSEYLGAYCAVKGYITGGSGRWDEFRACKDILRDYVDGKLLFAMPPDVEGLDRTQWMQETESIMIQNARVAERLVEQRAKEKALEEANGPIHVEVDGCEMVFGDGENFDNENIEEDTMESTAESDVTGVSTTTSTREHKRLKHWGKKNKKLRDKDPYGETNGVIAYVAHTTNRSYVPLNTTATKAKRQNLLESKEIEFVRVTHPHYVASKNN